jgi:RNA polymerase sigma factor (sigma-70 family)
VDRLTNESFNEKPNGGAPVIDFDTFYSASYERVRRAMVLTFRDPALAEEITQEAFFQTLRRWPKVSLLDHPEGWTMIAALNKGRDLHRRRVRQEAKQPLLIQRPTDQSGEARVEDQMMVATLLGGVSDRQREALLLRYVTQLTIPEIAEVMGCAEGTVKATLHAALANASHLAKDATHVTD